MSWLNLLQVELLKLKRSLALLMSILCPLSIVLLQLLLVIEGTASMLGKSGWNGFFMSSISLWYMLMLPLYVALLTTLINNNEHKNSTWRLMFTLPVNRWEIFVVKLFVAWLLTLFSSVVMFGFIYLAIGGLKLAGFTSPTPLDINALPQLLRVMGAVLPILVIGHFVSWCSKNIVVPLALGVIMTMCAMTLVRSEKYWKFDPWTYHMTATLTSSAEANALATQLGLGLGAVLLVIGAIWVNRREELA